MQKFTLSLRQMVVLAALVSMAICALAWWMGPALTIKLMLVGGTIYVCIDVVRLFVPMVNDRVMERYLKEKAIPYIGEGKMVSAMIMVVFGLAVPGM